MNKQEKKEILEELESEFRKAKQKYKIKTELEELDKLFGIKDKILRDGFVSAHLIRRIAYAEVELFMSWFNEFNSWLFPTGFDFVHGTEIKKFDEKDKKNISELFGMTARVNRKISVLGEHDDAENAKLIDELVDTAKKEFWPKLNPILKKAQKIWEEG